MQRSPKIAEVLPILYLRGLSTRDFREALPVLLGEQVSGLSPTITRLTMARGGRYRAFGEDSLANRDYLYIWAGGVHCGYSERGSSMYVGAHRRAAGRDQLSCWGVDDGYRENTESWASLLRGLKRRGMKAPAVAVGDGALGFWAAAGAFWPETR
jgi:transposase-like protein